MGLLIALSLSASDHTAGLEVFFSSEQRHLLRRSGKDPTSRFPLKRKLRTRKGDRASNDERSSSLRRAARWLRSPRSNELHEVLGIKVLQASRID
jgi:hypothetical protein